MTTVRAASSRQRTGKPGAIAPAAVYIAIVSRVITPRCSPAAGLPLDERAALVQVPAAVDAAWLDGKMVPVLRAKRTAMEAAIARLEYDASR